MFNPLSSIVVILPLGYMSIPACFSRSWMLHDLWCFSHSDIYSTQWRIRISKRGAKCLLDTSTHTKGGQTKFSNFLLCQKKNFLAKGGHGRFGQGVNTPLTLPSFFMPNSIIIDISYLFQRVCFQSSEIISVIIIDILQQTEDQIVSGTVNIW